MELKLVGEPEEISELLFTLCDDSDFLNKEVEDNSLVENVKDMQHFSKTKGKWLDCKEMHPLYIMNVIATMFEEATIKDNYGDFEFKSLILNLADRIKEGLDELEESESNVGESGCPNCGGEEVPF